MLRNKSNILDALKASETKGILEGVDRETLSELGKKLSEQELETLAIVAYVSSKVEGIGNRGTFTSNEVKFEEQQTGGAYLKSFNCFGDTREKFVKAAAKAEEIKVAAKVEATKENSGSKFNLGTLKALLQEDREELKETEQEQQWLYRYIISQENIEEFDDIGNVLKQFNTRVSSIVKIFYSNIKNIKEAKKAEKEVWYSIECQTKSNIWRMELPFFDKNGFMRRNGKLYAFSFIPRNLKKYLKGEDEQLILYSPHKYILEEALTASKNRATGERTLWSQEIFENAVKNTDGEKRCRSIQKRINEFLTNSEKGGDKKKEFQPLVWVAENKSQEAISLLSKNIGLNLSYETLAKYKLVPGVDLLSGSTSKPGVRCKIASNWDLKTNSEGNLVLTKVKGNAKLTDEKGDYMCDVKNTVGTHRTSAKRDNTSTLKDTYKYVSENTLERRVRIK